MEKLTMELEIRTKANWILAGRIALGVICVLATVLSLFRLGNDQWRTLWEWLSDLARNSPLGFAIIATGIVSLFLVFGLYLCGDKRTRRVLLPMCILLPLHLAFFQYITFLAPILNLILLLALIPCAIEAVARKKPFLGIAAALYIFYLLAGLYLCCKFWSDISHLAK